MAEFRVIMIPSFHGTEPGFGITDIQSYEMAKKILDALTDYTMHLHKIGLMDEFSNIGFVEKYKNGEWVEYDVLGA